MMLFIPLPGYVPMNDSGLSNGKIYAYDECGHS